MITQQEGSMSTPIDKARGRLNELQKREREMLADSIRMAELFDKPFETMPIEQVLDFLESVKDEYESLQFGFEEGQWLLEFNAFGTGRSYPTFADAIRAELVREREELRQFLIDDLERYSPS